ncbi:P-loop ATPase, Sll1717 family [Shinella granuli]|uniref:Uncharacterized protein n=1 Tax=Shinella granuli TaxID=323621 RepID=A0A4R2D0W3_SHIGR|nr:hypothetical protein [Shinella granuli]TCN46342.1 hypothetical protein EV665_10413 [Shinella granuli]
MKIEEESEDFDQFLGDGNFGNPDATTADLEKAAIQMGLAFPSLSIAANRLSTHLIVGRKGAGKTFHWRTLEAAAKSRHEVIAITDNGALSEAAVKALSARAGNLSPDHFWSLVWRRAIFSFLASLFYSTRQHMSFDNVDRLKSVIDKRTFIDRFDDIFSEPLVELTPVKYVEKFSSMEKRHLFENFIQSDLWVELETVMQASIPENSPIYIFIDAIDAQADTIPQMWHDCQYGLLVTILNLIREMKGRLHIVATIRDSVYRARVGTEHGTKVVDDNHIRILNWGRRENEYFAREKIIRSARLKIPSKASINDVMDAWLGFSSIFNKRRGIEENAAQYILRHTRCLPRDVVIVGNEISRELLVCRRTNEKFSPGRLRKAVEACSKLFANESVETCLTEMLVTQHSVEEYARMLRQRPDDSDAIKYHLREEVERFVRLIGKQVFDSNELQSAISSLNGKSNASTHKDTRYRIDNVFWRNGLIAYKDDRGGGESKWIYNWYAVSENENLPSSAKRYGFHPSIADRYMLELTSDELVY